MISEVERNYSTHNWTELTDLPHDAEGLTTAENARFCNSSSRAFENMLDQGRGERAFLLDYELLSLNIDPLCGMMLYFSKSYGICMVVFTGETNRRIFKTPFAF